MFPFLVTVFAAGHRTLYKTDLRNFDVVFRKLLRSVVGPPAGMDWTRPWHEILHDWNGRVNEFAALHGIKLWSQRCVQQHWSITWYATPSGCREGTRPHLLVHFKRFSSIIPVSGALIAITAAAKFAKSLRYPHCSCTS